MFQSTCVIGLSASIRMIPSGMTANGLLWDFVSSSFDEADFKIFQCGELYLIWSIRGDTLQSRILYTLKHCHNVLRRWRSHYYRQSDTQMLLRCLVLTVPWEAEVIRESDGSLKTLEINATYVHQGKCFEELSLPTGVPSMVIPCSIHSLINECPPDIVCAGALTASCVRQFFSFSMLNAAGTVVRILEEKTYPGIADACFIQDDANELSEATQQVLDEVTLIIRENRRAKRIGVVEINSSQRTVSLAKLLLNRLAHLPDRFNVRYACCLVGDRYKPGVTLQRILLMHDGDSVLVSPETFERTLRRNVLQVFGRCRRHGGRRKNDPNIPPGEEENERLFSEEAASKLHQTFVEAMMLNSSVDPLSDSYDHSLRRVHILENLSLFLRALSLRNPLILMIDDFHLMDGLSKHLLLQVLSSFEDGQITLIVSSSGAPFFEDYEELPSEVFRIEHTHESPLLRMPPLHTVGAEPLESAFHSLRAWLENRGSDDSLLQISTVLTFLHTLWQLIHTSSQEILLESFYDRKTLDNWERLLLPPRSSDTPGSDICHLLRGDTLLVIQLLSVLNESVRLQQLIEILQEEVPLELVVHIIDAGIAAGLLKGVLTEKGVLISFRYQDWGSGIIIDLDPRIAGVLHHKIVALLSEESKESVKGSGNITVNQATLSRLHVRKGDFKKAITYLEEASLLASALGEYKIARHYLNEAIKLCSPQSSRRISLFLHQAKVLQRSHMWDESLAVCRTAEEMARNMGNDRFVAESGLLCIATLKQQGNRSDIPNIIRGLEPVVRKMEDPKLLGQCLYELGDTFLALGNIEKAEPCFNRYKKLAETKLSPVEAGKAYVGLGLCNAAKQKFHEALACFRKRLVLDSQINSPEDRNILMIIGDIYCRFGKFPQAFEYYQTIVQSLSGKTKKDLQMEAKVKRRMGEIQLKKGFIADAQHLFERGLYCARESKDRHEEILMKTLITYTSLKQQMTLDAYEDLKSLLKTARSVKNRRAICILFIAMAHYFIKNGHWDRGDEYFDKAFDLSKKLSFHDLSIEIAYDRAMFKFDQRQYDEVTHWILQADHFIESNQSEELRFPFILLQARLTTVMKRKKKRKTANEAILKKLHSLKDYVVDDFRLAPLNATLFDITGDKQYGMIAYSLYQALYEQSENRYFLEQVRELSDKMRLRDTME